MGRAGILPAERGRTTKILGAKFAFEHSKNEPLGAKTRFAMGRADNTPSRAGPKYQESGTNTGWVGLNYQEATWGVIWQRQWRGPEYSQPGQSQNTTRYLGHCGAIGGPSQRPRGA